MPIPTQFGTRHWMVACILIALGISAIQYFAQLTPKPKYFLSLWIIPVPFRFVGAMIGARLGTVAKHALAWYAMVSSLASWILLLSFVRSPAGFYRDFLDGLAAGALICGMFVAAILEFYIGWTIIILHSVKRSEHERSNN
ncbi:MAG: hypothetical protein AAF664_06185 [Planctomycetota bacterium]